MPPTSTRAPGERPHYRRRQLSLWQRIPLLIRVAVPLLAISGGWFGHRLWRQSRSILTFVAAPGSDRVPALLLSFHREQFSFATPSPPPALGTLQLDGDAEALVGPDLVPDAAIVRYSGPGIGTGFARAVRGRWNEPVQLQPPAAVDGRVGVVDGFNCFGLRGLGIRPIQGARVLGLGGGEHGVLLCETDSDADGRFRLAGFAQGLPALGIRVLAAGHAMGFATWHGAEAPIIALVPTMPIEGLVDLPAGVDRATLKVLAKGLPGIESPIGADGRFAVDHVPPGLEPRLLVFGLPPEWTHQQTRGKPGDRAVRLNVVAAATLRGRVVDRQTQRPIGGAMVWHDHGPNGMTAVESDADGWFVLERTPPGSIALRAQSDREDPFGNRETLSGERRIDVVAGKDVQDLIVGVY